jgi:hypothetical protein
MLHHELVVVVTPSTAMASVDVRGPWPLLWRSTQMVMHAMHLSRPPGDRSHPPTDRSGGIQGSSGGSSSGGGSVGSTAAAAAAVRSAALAAAKQRHQAQQMMQLLASAANGQAPAMGELLRPRPTRSSRQRPRAPASSFPTRCRRCWPRACRAFGEQAPASQHRVSQQGKGGSTDRQIDRPTGRQETVRGKCEISFTVVQLRSRWGVSIFQESIK